MRSPGTGSRRNATKGRAEPGALGRAARFWARQAVDAALGVAVTVALFGAVEAALVLAGVGERLAVRELSRGFDATARYLVPDPAVPGGWRTQMANRYDSPEVAIPPKGERPRVLLFGGSNTKGFRGAHLAQHVERTLGRPVEVVNLGRAGYGSERVRIVFEQALAALDPDLVVLYSGHNEFVERGFLWDLQAAWGARWARAVVDLAQESRAVRVMADALSAGGADPRVDRPEEWRWEHEKFAELYYPSTLLAFDAYERNLEAMCALARASDVAVVLCTVVYNRFARPSVSNLPEDLAGDDRAAFEAHLARARAAYPPLFDALFPADVQERLHPRDWGKTAAQLPRERWEEPLQEGLRPAVGPLRDTPPRFPVQWPWSARVRPFYAALARFHAGCPPEAADERAALRAAEDELDRALAIVPDHPDALFERALVAYWLGRRDEEVARWFELAARYDRAPDRGNAVSNEAVRRVAQRAGVALLDADRLFSEGSPMGLVGWEWMGDQCHLNVGGMLVLMEELAAVVARRLGDG